MLFVNFELYMMYEIYKLYQSVGGSQKHKPKDNNFVCCFFKGDRSWLHKGKAYTQKNPQLFVTWFCAYHV